MATVRWKDKADAGTLVATDRLPITTDIGVTEVDKYFTPAEMATYTSANITITDNENTNESNAIIFSSGGDIDGGTFPLESDGTFVYNPSTGLVTATGFVGALTGNADTVTTITGLAPDTATTQAAQASITSLGTLTALTLSGQLSMADGVVERALLTDYSETEVAHGATGATETLDMEGGNVHSATIDEACTFTFSNPHASHATSFTLVLTNGSAFAVTWPASVDWPGGTAPNLTASGVDILTFVTIDGGTIWHGQLAALASATPA